MVGRSVVMMVEPTVDPMVGRLVVSMGVLLVDSMVDWKDLTLVEGKVD